MTKIITRILSSLLCFMLVAALALGMTACTNDTTDVSSAPSVADASSKEETKKVGEGENEFAFRVTDKDGNSTDFIVCTDKTIVGEALLEVGLIEGEEGQYGLFVRKVNGIIADFNVDKTYWAFYVDGEYGMTGVDQTTIESGKIYELRVSK